VLFRSVTEAATVAAADAARKALLARAADSSSAPVPSVSRLAGRDRYETAVAIAREVGLPDSGEFILVSGAAFPDALSASAYSGMTGAPILLTEQTRLAPAAEQFLGSADSTPSAALIVGGRGVVDTAIFQQLAAQGMSVRRAAGPNRYTTNLAVLQLLWPDGDISPYVATGADFPDALCAGAMAARDRQPVMLLAGQVMSPHQRQYLMHEQARIVGFTVIGGSRVLPYVAEWELQKAMRRH